MKNKILSSWPIDGCPPNTKSCMEAGMELEGLQV